MKIDSILLREKPLFLAPMEDVTEAPFRQICIIKNADMVYTEFISSAAIIRDADMALHKLQVEEMERAFGIQICGGEEEAMDSATREDGANNPDLPDIICSCPVV